FRKTFRDCGTVISKSRGGNGAPGVVHEPLGVHAKTPPASCAELENVCDEFCSAAVIVRGVIICNCVPEVATVGLVREHFPFESELLDPGARAHVALFRVKIPA